MARIGLTAKQTGILETAQREGYATLRSANDRRAADALVAKGIGWREGSIYHTEEPVRFRSPGAPIGRVVGATAPGPCKACGRPGHKGTEPGGICAECQAEQDAWWDAPQIEPDTTEEWLAKLLGEDKS